MNMSCYLSEFRPLAQTSVGQAVIEQHNLPPFIDASCRREPDLESPFPSITALCREGRLASILKEGDVVAYMTKDFAYPKGAASTRRLVAVLRVKKSWLKHRPRRGLGAHAQAAEWYRELGLPLPSNCMVAGNEPLALDRTDRYAIEGKIATTLEEWDDGYRSRAIECGAFHACDIIFCEVNDPPQMKTQQLNKWFGLIPNPREPEALVPERFILMLKWLCEQPIAAASRERLQFLIESLSHV
jgi:hypothetical protein